MCCLFSPQSPALLIPSVSLTRLPSRLRQSEERLDQELEKVFTHHSSVHHCGVYLTLFFLFNTFHHFNWLWRLISCKVAYCMTGNLHVTVFFFLKLYEVPDGRRAPIPHLSSTSGFQIGSSCVASHSSSSSSTSCSPQRPLDLETGRSLILKLAYTSPPYYSCQKRNYILGWPDVHVFWKQFGFWCLVPGNVPVFQHIQNAL